MFGYDENKVPLNSEQIFQDISQDHAKKTVTIETHSHEILQMASIHPCKHAQVMKKMIDQLLENGKVETQPSVGVGYGTMKFTLLLREWFWRPM